VHAVRCAVEAQDALAKDNSAIRPTGALRISNTINGKDWRLLSGVKAVSCIVAEPGKRRLLIGIGGDAAALDEDMLEVDFKLWVAGEDLPIKELKGQLNLGLQPLRRTKAWA
jgi:hypothetical protein